MDGKSAESNISKVFIDNNIGQEIVYKTRGIKMKFTSNRYLITEIIKPKSLFVTDIEAKVGDELEFVVELKLRGSSNKGSNLSSPVTVKNLTNGKTKQFVQRNLNNYLSDRENVLKMKEVY